MTPALHLRCKATRLILAEMTLAVSAYERSSNQAADFDILMLAGKFKVSYLSVTEVRPSFFDVPHIWSGPETQASRDLAAEHLLYISAFDTFISELLRKMDRQVWAEAGSAEDLVFKALWTMMLDTCTFFGSFPLDWPKRHIPDSHPIYATLQAIMLYIQPLTCSSSSSIQPWSPPLGRAVTVNEARVMIEPAWCTFNNMCLGSDETHLPLSLRALPLAYVHTLCSLAVEKLLDSSLPKRLTSDFFSRLMHSINCCVVVLTQAGVGRDVDPFRNPAVVEVFKRGMVGLRRLGAPTEALVEYREMMNALAR